MESYPETPVGKVQMFEQSPSQSEMDLTHTLDFSQKLANLEKIQPLNNDYLKTFLVKDQKEMPKPLEKSVKTELPHNQITSYSDQVKQKVEFDRQALSRVPDY